MVVRARNFQISQNPSFITAGHLLTLEYNYRDKGVHMCLSPQSNRPRISKFPQRTIFVPLESRRSLITLVFVLVIYLLTERGGGGEGAKASSCPAPLPLKVPMEDKRYDIILKGILLHWAFRVFAILPFNFLISASSVNLFHFQPTLFRMLLGSISF